jgi:hypothetical protein
MDKNIKENNFLELKVYRNKRNGQGIVMLPKKIFGDIKFIRVVNKINI